MARRDLRIEPSEDDSAVAYVRLTSSPETGTPRRVQRTVRLRDLVGDYLGPDVFLDFAPDGTLLGLEVGG